MCLIVFAYKSHPEYDLVLATNRDEFYGRPTRPAQFWADEKSPDILAGKDLEAGGTWMGIHKNGSWAAVTNYRDPSIIKENPPSRGELVLNYLRGNMQAMDYLQDVTTRASEYRGFNLLLWDESGFYHYSNQSKIVSKIKAGIHGLSNAFLNTDWPKLKIAKSQLEQITRKGDIQKEALFQLLQNEQKAPENELPVTGIPQHLEKAVSSVFIKTESYGTRCSTLLLIDKEGMVDFTERSFKPGTSDISDERNFQFQI
ncbi:MAG: NRDE family protein [Balneolaceae bacterium]